MDQSNEEFDCGNQELDNQILEEQMIEENIYTPIKLDFTLESPQERNELVKKIIEQTPPERLTNKYIKILSDYIIFAMDKEERKQKKIITNNRLVTINKRETSYEGLVGKLESGEDGIHNMITNDKNMILTPKINITEQEVEEIKPLQDLKAAIADIEREVSKASGKKKFLLKKQLIEMYQDQYVIKNAFHQPMYNCKASGGLKGVYKLDMDENITINEDGLVVSDCILSIYNPKHISAVLCNYEELKKDCAGKLSSDLYYFMIVIDDLIEKTLKDHPLYYDLLTYKIDGRQNVEIQEFLNYKYNISYSLEYISSLWRNKIPKMIAEQAQEDYLLWYYTYKEKGYWKRCSRCKQIKLGHNKFFSKNKTSKDGYYSICKECRNKKSKDKSI